MARVSRQYVLGTMVKPFTPEERKALAKAWQQGGSMMLSAALSRIRPRFAVEDYGAAVQAAREELSDWTDYSQAADEVQP